MFFHKRLAVITAAILISFGATAQQVELQSSSLTRKEQRENRGISDMKAQIVPKGQWVFGGSLTYSTHTNSDYTFLIIEDIESTGYSVKVSPLVGYSLRQTLLLVCVAHIAAHSSIWTLLHYTLAREMQH